VCVRACVRARVCVVPMGVCACVCEARRATSPHSVSVMSTPAHFPLGTVRPPSLSRHLLFSAHPRSLSLCLMQLGQGGCGDLTRRERSPALPSLVCPSFAPCALCAFSPALPLWCPSLVVPCALLRPVKSTRTEPVDLCALPCPSLGRLPCPLAVLQ
jgi:hypothetical protein